MTIRAKIYAAIVLTVLGPLATIGVALWGMGEMANAFDQVQESSRRETIALQLKFDVTDMNGWQTAYGYDNGQSRPQFVRSVRVLEANLETARGLLVDPRERRLLGRLESRLDDFLELDVVIYRNVRAGREEVTRRLILGPAIVIFEDMAETAQALAGYEARGERATERDFEDTRRDARRGLILVALGAGLVIVLLLVTANDIVRLALEGQRHRDPA